MGQRGPHLWGSPCPAFQGPCSVSRPRAAGGEGGPRSGARTHRRLLSPRGAAASEQLGEFMESRGASSPGILVLTTGLSRPFMRLDKYPTLLKELERHMEVRGACRSEAEPVGDPRSTSEAATGQSAWRGFDLMDFQKRFCEILSFLLSPAPYKTCPSCPLSPTAAVRETFQN